MKQLKVALAHDFFLEYGGAERVVEAFHNMFPEAPVYTAFVDKHALGPQWKRFKDWDIRESWAAKIPFIRALHSPLRVLADKFFSTFDLSGYDLVISSTNMYMSKAIRVAKPGVHLCYCHTPPRSLYGYTTRSDWQSNPFTKLAGTLINHYMRMVDFTTSRNPDVFIANSKEVQSRIQKFYRRDSLVIYPPIQVPDAPPTQQKDDVVLFVGRLGMSKHVDLVVRACTKLKKRLMVVGTGKGLEYLQSIAGPTVEFLGSISDDLLHNLYARAQLLVYPAEDEDFGMIAVEAMAYGTPAIVHRSGGFLESVIDGKTGLFVDSFEVEEMVSAIKKAEKTQWDAKAIHTHAKKFSEERFRQEIGRLIQASIPA